MVKLLLWYDFHETSNTLTKLTCIYRQGFIKGPGTKGRKVIPPKSLSTEKDHCCDKGQWVDRDPPHGPPEGEFGIAFVRVIVKNVDQDKVDHAIAKLDGEGYASCEPPFTPITY